MLKEFIAGLLFPPLLIGAFILVVYPFMRFGIARLSMMFVCGMLTVATITGIVVTVLTNR